jgi:hypothetical protein
MARYQCGSDEWKTGLATDGLNQPQMTAAVEKVFE